MRKQQKIEDDLCPFIGHPSPRVLILKNLYPHYSLPKGIYEK